MTMMMMLTLILTLTMIREADTDLLHASGLIEKMEELTRDLIKKYKIYGDGVFPNVGNTTREERFENGIMTTIRIANEWAYGITENLYKIFKWSYGLKIRQNQVVSYYYLTATILRNAHCAMYGNQISEYFNCYPPSLEEYFGVAM
jgi:hypothetical protein